MIRGNSHFADVFSHRNFPTPKAFVEAVLASGILLTTVLAQSGQGTVSDTPAQVPTGANTISPKVSLHRPVELPPHAKAFYMAALGVDSLELKAVESGLMIRFSYRVVNPGKADPLNDKKISPYLVDQKTHRALVIPTLEKVGQLRQTSPPEIGKVYWMLFSNKGDFVKAGSRVSLVFGKSHIDGLVVQ
jgi:hypothetical protein